MNLDAGRFFPWVERGRHFWSERSAFGLAIAAVARRNGISVRAGFRVSEKRANALVQLRADDVLKLAGLRMRLGIIDGKSVFKKALGETVTTNNVARPLATYGRELHFPVLHLHQAKIGHARQNPRGWFIGHDRKLPCRAGGVEALGLC